MFDFDMLGLAPSLNEALLRLNFDQPTPIQAQAIPLALDGHDILGLAQTGTGKTLAFGLPLVEHLLAKPGRPKPKTAKALILAPTRELVNQIADSLRPLTLGTKLRIATVVGGQSLGKQITLLSRGTDILVATPGRLIDLMERGAVDLSSVRHLVLDEADQMLDLGFIHSLRKIAPKLGTPRQTMLFSATMSKQMEEIAGAYLTDPRRVQVAPPGKAADKITQCVHFLAKGDKPARLREILASNPDALTLVFARTKHGAEKLMKSLVADGFNAASIHGNKSQGQRDRAISAFRAGEVTILVATDVAARGIDIPGVAFVVNYDLPEVPDNYVHRIGRTARAGRDGEAIAFCTSDEVHLLKQIQKVMKMDVPVASGESPFAHASDAAGARANTSRGRKRPDRQRTDRGKPERTKSDQARSDRPMSNRNAQNRKRPQRSRDDRPKLERPSPEQAAAELDALIKSAEYDTPTSEGGKSKRDGSRHKRDGAKPIRSKKPHPGTKANRGQRPQNDNRPHSAHKKRRKPRDHAA